MPSDRVFGFVAPYRSMVVQVFHRAEWLIRHASHARYQHVQCCAERDADQLMSVLSVGVARSLSAGVVFSTRSARIRHVRARLGVLISQLGCGLQEQGHVFTMR